MHLSKFSAVLLPLITTALADPHDEIDWSKHTFQAPKEGDLRGPCPGLNTLANHGFISRTGRNLTISNVLKGALGTAFYGFNVPNIFLRTVTKLAILTSETEDDQFTLDDIKLHGTLEHDASVSRSDFALGSNTAFNATLYNETLAQSNPGVDYYNSTSAGLVQKARLTDSLARNPHVRNTIKEVTVRNAESALYLCVMGGCQSNRAPKILVDAFFREERLPIEEGWRRPPQATGDEVSVIVKDIEKVSEWSASGGQYPWVVLAPGATDDPLRDGRVV
ncbi:hypothetical protein VNI00_004507 [Paramarasmius palmivorus]|uniref:Heme haloperoxidase family profile domain-containing protein n=1 Tax=Paramarasmius palmivorus TaxID=297713 RepID=A0AAW0DI11_9AGAR